MSVLLYSADPYSSGIYGDGGVMPADPCADVKADLEEAKNLCRQQITLWRSQKPAKSWAWIRTQPAAKAYYGPLGGA